MSGFLNVHLSLDIQTKHRIPYSDHEDIERINLLSLDLQVKSSSFIKISHLEIRVY